MKPKHTQEILKKRHPETYWFGGYRMDTNRWRRAIKKPHRTNNSISLVVITGRTFYSRLTQ